MASAAAAPDRLLSAPAGGARRDGDAGRGRPVPAARAPHRHAGHRPLASARELDHAARSRLGIRPDLSRRPAAWRHTVSSDVMRKADQTGSDGRGGAADPAQRCRGQPVRTAADGLTSAARAGPIVGHFGRIPRSRGSERLLHANRRRIRSGRARGGPGGGLPRPLALRVRAPQVARASARPRSAGPSRSGHRGGRPSWTPSPRHGDGRGPRRRPP